MSHFQVELSDPSTLCKQTKNQAKTEVQKQPNELPSEAWQDYATIQEDALYEAKKEAQKQPKELPYEVTTLQEDALYEATQLQQNEEDNFTPTPQAKQHQEHELDEGDKAWRKRNESWLKQDADKWSASRSNTTRAASNNNRFQQEESHWYNTIGQEDILSNNVVLPPACQVSANPLTRGSFYCPVSHTLPSQCRCTAST